MRLLLASSNPHKAKELGELLPGVQLGPWLGPDIPENGAFFQDNAIQKAAFARDWLLNQGTVRIESNGTPESVNGINGIDGILADDSGLCVEALFGGPGVLSARFAPHLPYPEKNRLLLSMIGQGESRAAMFVCVLAFAGIASPLPEPLTVSGTVRGSLAFEVRGEGGFGYDPIFIPDGYDRTFGELDADTKNRLSHRSRAARALAQRLGILS
jgi:XTP/dITP diphosphohydrolase